MRPSSDRPVEPAREIRRLARGTDPAGGRATTTLSEETMKDRVQNPQLPRPQPKQQKGLFEMTREQVDALKSVKVRTGIKGGLRITDVA